MRKIFRLATLLILATSFGLPIFAGAQSCTTAGSPCSTPDGVAGTCVQQVMGLGCVGGMIPSNGQTVNTVNRTGPGGVNLPFIQRYSASIINIINSVFAPVLLAVAFLTFLWGIYKYFILGATEEKSREEGRSFLLWSIIGFVVIFSIWGLVAIVGSTFGLTAGGAAPSYPTL